jgi:hypothetical protein
MIWSIRYFVVFADCYADIFLSLVSSSQKLHLPGRTLVILTPLPFSSCLSACVAPAQKNFVPAALNFYREFKIMVHIERLTLGKTEKTHLNLTVHKFFTCVNCESLDRISLCFARDVDDVAPARHLHFVYESSYNAKNDSLSDCQRSC